MGFIGEISYGMYLLHMLAINAVRPLVGARFGLTVFVSATAVVTGMAYVSYRWFETPILRYRDRLRRAPSHTAAQVPATGRVPAAPARFRA